MGFDEFTGTIQHRLELPGTGETVRATLSTLGERLQEGEARQLGSTRPMEVGWYLTGPAAEHGQRIDWYEFVTRVGEITGAERPEAAYPARVVVDLAAGQVPESELGQVREQLPEDEDDENWRKLFEVVEAGGWGAAEEAQTDGGPQP